MNSSTFRDWRRHLGLSQTAAADALGVSPRMVVYYEAGRDIPKPVELACAALALGIRSYDGPQ